MQLLAIQFTIKMLHIGFMKVGFTYFLDQMAAFVFSNFSLVFYSCCRFCLLDLYYFNTCICIKRMWNTLIVNCITNSCI